MRTKCFDCLVYIAALIVVLYVLGLHASAQEFNDESYSNRLDRALQQSLEELGSRVTVAEDKIKQLEQRVAGLVQTDEEPHRSAKDSHPTPATPAVSSRWTTAELNSWVKSRYGRSTPLSWTVAQGYSIYSHLKDGRHAFTSDQVDGLESWVAYALHDASHRGLIQPYRSGQVVATSTERTVQRSQSAPRVQAVRTYTVQATRSGCPNGNCWRGQPLRTFVRRVFR